MKNLYMRSQIQAATARSSKPASQAKTKTNVQSRPTITNMTGGLSYSLKNPVAVTSTLSRADSKHSLIDSHRF